MPQCLPCLSADFSGLGGNGMVCGGPSQGKCLGEVSTFSHRSIAAQTVKPLADNKLETLIDLTTCSCSSNFTGATCSLPAIGNAQPCNGFSMSGGSCNCLVPGSPVYAGYYCEGIEVLDTSQAPSTCSSSSPCVYVDDAWKHCNGRGELGPDGKCTCGAGYSSESNCLEVEDVVYRQRQADVCMCLNSNLLLDDAIKLCSEVVASSLVTFRSCDAAFPFV